MKHTLHTTKLINGAEILFVNVPGSTSYYFNTIVNAGYNYATKDKYELPHLLEHLAFEGSANYPKTGQMAYQLEKLGGWYNATTSDEDIRYFLVGSIKDYKIITELGVEQYSKPLFKTESIVKQKMVIARELERYINEDSWRVRDNIYTTLFPDKLNFAKDCIDTLKNITQADIMNFYKTTHTTANTVFVVSGDLPDKTRSEIVAIIEANLVGLPRGKKLNAQRRLRDNYNYQIKTMSSKHKNQIFYGVIFIKEPYSADINYHAACEVAEAIYNKGNSSRIFTMARASGLAYDVDSGISIVKDYSDLYIYGLGDPHLVGKLFELCIKELVEITKGNFSPAELERAIGYQAGEYDTEYETSRDLADWYGPMFAANEAMYSPADFSAAIRKIRKQDVVKVLASFVKSDNWLVSLVGHGAETLKPSFEEIIAKYL